VRNREKERSALILKSELFFRPAPAQEIRMQRNRELEDAKGRLAVGESNLKAAFSEWQQVSEQAPEGREEQ